MYNGLKSLWSWLPGNLLGLFCYQDAFEFFSNLTDQVDEVLKKSKHPQVFQQTLGGVFLDQKLCRGCEHKLVLSSEHTPTHTHPSYLHPHTHYHTHTHTYTLTLTYPLPHPHTLSRPLVSTLPPQLRE